MYHRFAVPQPELGRIHQLNVHGTKVYLTGQEDLNLDLLYYGMMIAGIVAIFYNYFFDPFDMKKKEKEYKRLY